MKSKINLFITFIALMCLAAGVMSAQTVTCAFPSTISTSMEETAWQLFIAAVCPTEEPKHALTWEKWPEQAQVYPRDSAQATHLDGTNLTTAKQRFHASGLARVFQLNRNLPTTILEAANTGCVAKASGRTICEEVRLNPMLDGVAGSVQYITSNDLYKRYVQGKVAGDNTLKFPPGSIEIKVDWIQYKGVCPATFKNQLWTEILEGNCYALAGLHISSKLLPNWVWATFEPQNMTSNPMRCVVLGCDDQFGSVPAKTPKNVPGAKTQVSQRLRQMMLNANLSAVWLNYRLDGVQTDFVDAQGKPTLLGNSIIEGENVGMDMEKTSCITCHHASSIKQDGADGIQNIGSNPRIGPIGNPKPLPEGYFLRDFVWSLSMACRNSTLQNCNPTARSVSGRQAQSY